MTDGILAGLSWLGETLDKPGRALRGLLAGRPAELANLTPFSDTLGWTDPDSSVSGRGLLETWGALRPNQEGLDAGDAAGFLLEMALDPVNLVGAGLSARIAKMAGRAGKANLAREALLAKGAMPGEAARATKLVDEAGNPAKFFHGTPWQFERFDPEKLDPGALYGPGVYATSNPAVASGYANATRGKDVLPMLPQEEMIEELARRVRQVGVKTVGGRDVTESVAGMAPFYLTNPDYWTDYGVDVSGLFQRAAPNVRAHFLDIRNPFDVERRYATEEAETLLRGALGPPKRPGVSEYMYPNQTPTGESLYSILAELSGSKAAANEALQRAGYDAIMHQGGRLTGAPPHQVFIALDPAQVYAPFVAPAAVPVPRQSPLLAALAGHNLGAAFAPTR